MLAIVSSLHHRPRARAGVPVAVHSPPVTIGSWCWCRLGLPWVVGWSNSLARVYLGGGMWMLSADASRAAGAGAGESRRATRSQAAHMASPPFRSRLWDRVAAVRCRRIESRPPINRVARSPASASPTAPSRRTPHTTCARDPIGSLVSPPTRPRREQSMSMTTRLPRRWTAGARARTRSRPAAHGLGPPVVGTESFPTLETRSAEAGRRRNAGQHRACGWDPWGSQHCIQAASTGIDDTHAGGGQSSTG